MIAHKLAEALRSNFIDHADKERSHVFYGALTDSHKFDVTALCSGGAPDIELTYFGIDLIYEGIFRLPFQAIYMESAFRLPDDVGGIVTLGLIGYQVPNEDDTLIVIDSYWHTKDQGWNAVGGIASILVPKNPIDRAEDKGNFFSDGRVLRVKIDTEGASDEEQEKRMTGVLRSADIFIGSIAAIESKSTTFQVEKTPEKLNKKREKSGKIPLYEHRIVTLCAPAHPRDKNDNDVSDRASPRMHWRRGHIRNLPTGKRVPVSPSLVGLAENGVISHEYRARRIPPKTRDIEDAENA